MNLNLYDSNLNRIAIIGNQYVSCLWSEGYNTVENFTLEVVATDDYKRKIRVDCYVGRTDRPTLMVVKTVEFSGGNIVASGKQATRVLDDVAFVGTIPENSLIDKAILDAYNSGNKYRNVEFADTDLQVSYEHQLSNTSILDLCEIMCQNKDVGFKAEKQGKLLIVSFYKPAERANLVFSQNFGNLFVNSISISNENLKNYAIVLGQGEGDQRAKAYVDATNGADRRELVVDAKDLQREEGETDSNYNSRLVSRGVEKLLEKQQTFSCDFSPHAADFGSKYDLGDIITVYLTDYGITIKARISRFTQKSQRNKISTSVEVGQITIKR